MRCRTFCTSLLFFCRVRFCVFVSGGRPQGLFQRRPPVFLYTTSNDLVKNMSARQNGLRQVVSTAAGVSCGGASAMPQRYRDSVFMDIKLNQTWSKYSFGIDGPLPYNSCMPRWHT